MEAERAFSVMTLFANKLKIRLNDDTLSAMMVLPKVLQKINSINLIVHVYMWYIKLPLASLAFNSK